MQKDQGLFLFLIKRFHSGKRLFYCLFDKRLSRCYDEKITILEGNLIKPLQKHSADRNPYPRRSPKWNEFRMPSRWRCPLSKAGPDPKLCRTVGGRHALRRKQGHLWMVVLWFPLSRRHHSGDLLLFQVPHCGGRSHQNHLHHGADPARRKKILWASQCLTGRQLLWQRKMQHPYWQLPLRPKNQSRNLFSAF